MHVHKRSYIGRGNETNYEHSGTVVNLMSDNKHDYNNYSDNLIVCLLTEEKMNIEEHPNYVLSLFLDHSATAELN